MLQLAQYLRNGKMELIESPFPGRKPGYVIVKNHFSVISSGTESRTVKDARAGLISKAVARQGDVKKVITTAKKLGVAKAKKIVNERLNTPVPLGYSCCGEVIDVAPEVVGIHAGDLIACAGQHASHAEVVSVPFLFCAKVPDGVSGEYAAFATIGAIAMQAFRQASLQIGEHAVVIGLGLLGQIVVQLCAAAGIHCTGIDLEEEKIRKAIKGGADHAFMKDDKQLESNLLQESGGVGADAVIICASSNNTDPINNAGLLCRKKGKVVLAGNAPSGFDRKNYYRKELTLLMSSSYGPGRYDTDYEELQKDYPIAYVRWTAQRNMQAYLDLLAAGRLKPDLLISHRFPFKNAHAAYQELLDNNSKFTGIVLEYDSTKALTSNITNKRPPLNKGKKIKAGFIGAGKFAKSFLLPHLKDRVELLHLANASPLSTGSTAEKFGFTHCTGNGDEVIKNKDVNTVFITTRHDTHAHFVLKALENNKHVFVEKPLCLNESELEEITLAHADATSILMLGFNRRFAPFTIKALENIPNSPRIINIRVNAGKLPADHWVHQRETGGGRIIGETCHFIDLASCFAQSNITSVAANILPEVDNKEDSLTVMLRFENGSIANISYFSNGSEKLSKELIEVHCAGKSLVIDDFNSLYIYGKKTQRFKSGQDKGHANEMKLFVKTIEEGIAPSWDFEQIRRSMLATLRIAEAAKNGKVISIS